MIPTATDTTVITGSLGGESQAFQIDPESFNFIMKILTDMYSDPEGAVLREYACNALDEHVKANQTKPIRIGLPTLANPFFEIEDWGSGLNKDEIFDIYRMYGLSTKRGTDGLIGTFGLGSKSALTYTNSFTIIATKNEVRTTIAITKNAEGVGVATIVDEYLTDEPNGVLVKIPVKSVNKFRQKCENFFRFWKPGTVEVDGTRPKHLIGEEICSINYSEEMFTEKPLRAKVFIEDSLDQCYIVMGPVAYPIKNSYNEKIKYIARVNIGNVEITPSREDLYYNKRTNAAIARITDHLYIAIARKANTEINKASTPADAWNARQKWQTRLGSSHPALSNLDWNGVPFPTSFKLPGTPGWNWANGDDPLATFICYKPRHGRYAVDGRKTTAYYSELYPAVLINGYKADGTVSTNNKLKIKQYLNDNGWNPDRVFLFKEIPDNPWLEGSRIVEWKDIAAIKISASLPGTGAQFKLIPGSWEQYTKTQQRGNYYQEITVLDTSKPIIYVSPTDYRDDSYSYHRDKSYLYLDVLPGDAQFLRLPKNRWDKFKRQFPTAIHITGWMQQEFKKFSGALTDDEKIQLSLSDFDRAVLKELDPARLNDPVLANVARVAKLPNTVTVKANKFNAWRKDYTFKFDLAMRNSAYLNDYPLVSTARSEHCIIYINAVYALTNT